MAGFVSPTAVDAQPAEVGGSTDAGYQPQLLADWRSAEALVYWRPDRMRSFASIAQRSPRPFSGMGAG